MKGQTGQGMAGEIQAIEPLPAPRHCLGPPAAGHWGSRALLYGHSSLEGSWVLGLGSVGIWDTGAAVCVLWESRAAVLCVCVMDQNHHSRIWLCSHTHRGGGGHPGGSHSISVGWHRTRNGLEFADSVLISVFARISRGRFEC